MSYIKFKKEILNKKKELKKSDKLSVKIPIPFKKNPLKLWWGFPSLIIKSIIGNLISILPPCFLQTLLLKILRVKIGKNVGIAIGFRIDDWFPDLIEIEDNVIIGKNVSAYTHDITKSRVKLGKVIIKKDSMVGAHSIIGAGVTIGKNSKVAIGSVITTDTDTDKMYTGYHKAK